MESFRRDCLTFDPQVSPTMCAEELTNQVLFMRNVPVGDKHMWMVFEAVEDGQLGASSHPSACVRHLGCCPHCLTVSSLQSGRCTPKRRSWNRCCVGARWPTPGPPTWW